MLPALLLFALFAASAYAYQVGIKVTVAQDTLAVGTNVTIVKDGVLLYNARAGADGTVSFDLDAGSYFVYLDRGGYSRHVNLLEVSGVQNVTYTMRQTISYAGAYGQVTGPADFSNASVTAFSNGNVVKRVSPNKDGYYFMSFLPEGDYNVIFTAQGFIDATVPAQLAISQFSEVDAKLGKTPAVVAPTEAISAPPNAQKGSVIDVLVTIGGSPFAAQAVSVSTPGGVVSATTGTDGKAHVNAAMPGKYVFTFGNLTATTVVAGAANSTPPQPVQNTTEPPAPQASEPQQPVNPGVAAGVVALVLVCIILVLGAVIFVAARMRKAGPKAPPAGEHHGAKHTHQHKKK